MDPVTLAGLAVAAVVNYLGQKAGRLARRAGQDVDGGVDERLDRLYDAVKARLTGSPPAARMLDGLADDPADARRQGRLEFALEDVLASDPAFAATLERLVADLGDQRPGGVVVKDAGAVSLGGDVNMRGTYVSGRDMNIGDT